MASPLGHSLVSCYFVRPCARVSGRERPSLWDALFMMVLASLPDLDVLLPPFGPNGLFHRTVTHSFFFALWMGCVLALFQTLLLKGKGPLLKRAALYAAVIATHPLLDYFAVLPPYTGAMPLFWPFSGTFFASPVALFPTGLTYLSNIPVRESLLKTFAGESALALPLLGYEALRALRSAPARKRESESLGPVVLPTA